MQSSQLPFGGGAREHFLEKRISLDEHAVEEALGGVLVLTLSPS